MNSIIVCALLCVVVSVHAALPPGQSLYAPYAFVPAEAADTSTVNVGVQFTVDVGGNVTGCVVYRHLCVNYQTCTLYDRAGNQLAQSFFPAAGQPTGGSEVPGCSEGWISSTFSSPYFVSPNVLYTISALVDNGGYDANNTGFTAARTVGHIHVPAQGGVYNTHLMPSIPTQVFQSTEYFISPLFTPSTTPPTPVPTQSPTGVQSLYAPYTVQPPIDSDAQAVSVGVQFTVDAPGTIVGCAVYSGNGGCGASPNSCDLWDSNGSQLVDVSFPCQNGAHTGWIFVNFTTPYAITANTPYTVSSLFQAGHYAAVNNGFTSARTVGHIHVPANGGVYSYHFLPAFPTDVFESSEYFVTPLFKAN